MRAKRHTAPLIAPPNSLPLNFVFNPLREDKERSISCTQGSSKNSTDVYSHCVKSQHGYDAVHSSSESRHHGDLYNISIAFHPTANIKTLQWRTHHHSNSSHSPASPLALSPQSPSSDPPRYRHQPQQPRSFLLPRYPAVAVQLLRHSAC